MGKIEQRFCGLSIGFANDKLKGRLVDIAVFAFLPLDLNESACLFSLFVRSNEEKEDRV